MTLEIYAVETKTGTLLAQLPGTPSGPLAREASGFSSASFTISVDDPAMPAGWESLLEAHRCSILAVDDREGVRTPVWLGLINQVAHTDAGLEAQCASTEWLLDTRRATDAVWGATTDIMKIVRDLHTQFEANGAGVGLAVDAPDTGVKRAWSVKRSDGKSFMACLEELGLEWAIDLSLTDTKVVKTLRVRSFDPAAGQTPATVVQVPAHTSSWRFTESRLEAEAATVVYVEGDGTGDTKTVSTPVIDTAREAAGYPRVEAWESVSGVTSSSEAGKLAKQFAARRFLDHEAVEITVRNSADGTPLSGLRIGDSVRVVIDTPTLQRTGDYRLASWEVEPSGDSWTPVLAPAGLSLYGWRRPTAKAAALKVRELGKHKGRDPFGAKYISPIANSDGDRLTFDAEKGAGWTAPDGTFKPYGAGSGAGGGSTPGGSQPEWGDGSEAGWSGAPAAKVKAIRARGEAQSTPITDAVFADESGRFYSAVHAGLETTAYMYRSGEQARPVPEAPIGVLVFGGILREGVATDYRARGAATLSPEMQQTILDLNPFWETAAMGGGDTTWSSAEIRLASQKSLAELVKLFATGGHIYLPFTTIVSGAFETTHRGLLRWAVDEAGSFTGDPEVVLGSLAVGAWPDHFRRISTNVALAFGGGSATVVGLSSRGVEKIWELPALPSEAEMQTEGSSSSAALMPRPDGSGMRVCLGSGYEIPVSDKLMPEATEWTSAGPFSGEAYPYATSWTVVKGVALRLLSDGHFATAKVGLGAWTTSEAISIAAPHTGPFTGDRNQINRVISFDSWVYGFSYDAIFSAQIVEDNT